MICCSSSDTGVHWRLCIWRAGSCDCLGLGLELGYTGMALRNFMMMMMK